MHENCRKILGELQTFLDGECPDDFERLVVEHLHDCAPCLERAEFERELRLIVARKCREPAPDGLFERVVADLRLTRE